MPVTIIRKKPPSWNNMPIGVTPTLAWRLTLHAAMLPTRPQPVGCVKPILSSLRNTKQQQKHLAICSWPTLRWKPIRNGASSRQDSSTKDVLPAWCGRKPTKHVAEAVAVPMLASPTITDSCDATSRITQLQWISSTGFRRFFPTMHQQCITVSRPVRCSWSVKTTCLRCYSSKRIRKTVARSVACTTTASAMAWDHSSSMTVQANVFQSCKAYGRMVNSRMCEMAGDSSRWMSSRVKRIVKP